MSTIGNDDTAQVKRRSRVRERRFSASLTDTMDSLGLGLDLDLDTVDSAGPSRPMPIRSTILEEREPQDSDESSQSGDSEAEDGNEDEEEGQGTGHLDPFEREWAEKWLNGVVRRAQGWIEEHEDPEDEEDIRTLKHMEAILRDSTAVLAMMAGTSGEPSNVVYQSVKADTIIAAGSLTRHLLLPLHDSLAHGVKALQQMIPLNPALSPTTTSFLASLATSPVSPTLPFRPGPTSPERPSSSNPAFSPETQRRRRRSTLKSNSDMSSSPESRRNTASRGSERRRKKAAVPVLLHDAPMQDHISVGVQTWGSAILLGREMALNPSAFGLFPGPSTPTHRGVRVLELGAGTGLLAILCRKLLDLRMASMDVPQPKYPGLVVATDFHHDVLSNLKVCVDLNFPPHVPVGPNSENAAVVAINGHVESGVKIAKLDWTTFPQYMVARQEGRTEFEEDNLEVGKWVGDSFDLVLASDCVYDPTHAKLIRDVAGWVLRLPEENDPNDQGGTLVSRDSLRETLAND